jgi:T-complex protein 1 subunit delta
MSSSSSSQPQSQAARSRFGFKDKDKPDSVRSSNMVAAKAVADAIRTSLGPKGMDKMIQSASGEVTITNDGATILNQMSVVHPTAKMVLTLREGCDMIAGDSSWSSCPKRRTSKQATARRPWS